MEDRESVASWSATVARTGVGALLLVAALPPALVGVAMIALTRDRVTRYGYSTLEAASAPISGTGLLLVASGLAFLALCAFSLRGVSRRMGFIFLVAGAALFAGGWAIGWDPYFAGTG